MRGAERFRQRPAARVRVDVPRLGMNRNAAGPADGVVLDQLDRRALDHGEGRGAIVMEMRNGVDVGPRPHEFGVKVDFRRRPHIGWARKHLAIEIADQQIIGPETRARMIARLDQQRIAPRQPRADVAAVAQQAEIVEQQRARRDLLAELLLARLRSFGMFLAAIVLIVHLQALSCSAKAEHPVNTIRVALAPPVTLGDYWIIRFRG